MYKSEALIRFLAGRRHPLQGALQLGEFPGDGALWPTAYATVMVLPSLFVQ